MENKLQNISGYARYKTVLKERISNEVYRDLRDYALSKNVDLSNYKDYTGDIQEIKEIIDKIVIVAKDFPKILCEKNRVILDLHFEDDEAFAGTRNHIITLNGIYYDDVINLKNIYFEKEQENHFVRGTSYKDIIYHELGHVVANIYKIDTLEVLKSVTGLNSNTKLMSYVLHNLSSYAVSEYEKNGFTMFDTGEVIAECFCGYYSNSENEFARRYVEMCIDIAKKGVVSMKNKARKMSISTEKTFWLKNPAWYRVNEEKDCFEILDTAPVKAKISFEVWSGKRKSKAKGFFSKLR